MGYSEEKNKIVNYVTKDGDIIELTPNRSNEKQYYKEVEILNTYKKLAIRFPGYKTTKTKCDYCVYLVEGNVEKPVSHVEIMQDIYNKTDEENCSHLKKYVEDVARIGKDVKKENYDNIDFNSGFTFEELTGLMFYIAIQEDINYPGERYQGRKMCFYRYLEAIYCKNERTHTFDEASQRAKAKGFPPQKWTDVGNLYYNIDQIKR